MKNLKIISGGQTGADLAGLWAARLFNIPTGGKAPHGWKTSIGNRPQLEKMFDMCESSNGYHGRTLENCEMSDLTLIFASNIKSPGTKLTLHHCIKNKIHYQVFPLGSDVCKCVDQTSDRVTAVIKNHIAIHDNSVINIAGNSTPTSPQAFTFTFFLLCRVFESILGDKPSILKKYDISKIEAMLRDNYDTGIALSNVELSNN